MCCPSGYTCEKQQEDGSWMCVSSDVYGCSDYKTEEECKDYSLGVAIKDNEEKSEYGEGFCTDPYSFHNPTSGCWEYVTNCRCEWNGSMCVPVYSLGESCNHDISVYASCYRPDSEVTNCSDGYRYVKWDWFYKLEDGTILTCSKDEDCEGYITLENIYCNTERGLCESDNCKAGDKMIPCISGALLPFASLISFIIAILIIIIFYLIVSKKKRGLQKNR